MPRCNVEIMRSHGKLDEVIRHYPSGWSLCLQRCRYHYEGGDTEDGCRWMWRRPDGTLQAARGQARIPFPSFKIMREMIDEAERAGWDYVDSDEAEYQSFPAAIVRVDGQHHDFIANGIHSGKV